MSALICGSFAFDTIMVFEDKFKNHILPEKVHILNISFVVPEMRREFGGCAGNIAYNLKLLGENPLPMGTVGQDFAPYAERIDCYGICRDFIREIKGSYTAQAFIITDMDDNQINAFHPGAMNFSHKNRIDEAKNVKIGIISPDGRQGMIEHAAQFAEMNIPFIFDPGQQMPMFNGSELLTFIEQAKWLTLNDYESQLMQERTCKSLDQIAEMVDALIVTYGSEGSIIYTPSETIQIPAVKANAIKDPTGCGDAYRAGLLYGLIKGIDWETTGRIASLMGALKIEEYGTQNHHFDKAAFEERFEKSFGYKL